mgnify:CR=1 FL=1
MKTYEMIYVLDASLADEAKEALGKKFEDIVLPVSSLGQPASISSLPRTASCFKESGAPSFRIFSNMPVIGWAGEKRKR